MADTEKLKLEKTIRSLLARIEENQRIQQHFHAFEFRLLACSSLEKLLQLVFEEMPGHFRLVDLGMVLIDRDYTLRGLFQTMGIGNYSNRLQLRHNDEFSENLYGNRVEVSLGPIDALTSSRLFPNTGWIGSAALLPMLRQGQMLGSLHLASPNTERFTADKSTDFMEHLAVIMSVCLENCISHEHLRLQNQTDMLTQVRNRKCFEQEFIKELARNERDRQALSCMFVDVDHFKSINDLYGHQAGDICLRQVASAIQGQLRKTDLLARYGGEEFVVLLPKCELDAARVIAERVRGAVAHLEVNTDAEQRIRPTVSIGLSTWQVHSERSPLEKLGQRLLQCADEAMYQAKAGGRNQVAVKHFYQVVPSEPVADAGPSGE